LINLALQKEYIISRLDETSNIEEDADGDMDEELDESAL